MSETVARPSGPRRRPCASIGVRHHDQVVHRRREAPQLLLVLARADAGRVDGRRSPTAAGGRPRRARWRPWCPRSRRGTCGCGPRPARMSARWAARIPVAIASSGSSITVTGMPRRSSLRTALPGESETTDDVVALAVEARDQVVDVLLGAAVRAGGQDLDDADPRPRRVPAVGPRATHGSSGRGRRHRIAVRRTSRRWIGSSTAPHSYLYGSSPRRKSNRGDAALDGAPRRSARP